MNTRTVGGRIAPQTGTAFFLKRGEILRVTDPQGEQVSDLMAFVADETGGVARPLEWLSSGRTLDYAETIYVSTGHVLYSQNSLPLLTIVADTCGRHDFLLTPCSPETFAIIYKNTEYHPSCYENLWRNLAPFGVAPHEIPTSFNLFMNVTVDGMTGKLAVLPPTSRSGDYIELRAERDLVIGLTACSAEMSNNYSFKPIDYAVFEKAM
ncbi:MAG: urea carboxylase-associated family protein [Akkermansiaceae bacterium]|nr:urea carboxylase-associated family protein [Armatimonadota bacterium]